MIYYMGGVLAQSGYLDWMKCKDGFFLETFYSIRGNVEEKMNKIFSVSSHIIIDSGAFTFMNARKDNVNETSMNIYFNEYCSFIKKYKDDPRIEGFFELDIDRVLGVDLAMKYLNHLTALTDKIIPVWHNTRTIDFYYYMCKNYKKVAITQAMKNDIDDSQINYFINTAHYFGTHIHLLGFTRFNTLDNLNLKPGDSFDSVSHCLTAAFGNIKLSSKNYKDTYTLSFEKLENLNTRFLHVINNYYSRKIQKQLYENDFELLDLKKNSI